MRALEQARTAVCEPVVRVSVEVPADSIGTVLPVLARFGSVVATPSVQGRLATIETIEPAARGPSGSVPRRRIGEAVLDQPLDCDNVTGTETSATDADGWKNTLTIDDIKVTAATITVVCTIVIDP